MTRPVDPSQLKRRKPDIPRTLILPPADRAYWQPPASDPGPLLYLAWGERQFASAPIARHRHHGWVYVVVSDGSPTLVREHRTERLAKGALVIMGPDCAFGWQDEPGRRCKLLVWMWRRPLLPPIALLPPDSFVRRTLKPDEHAELRHLHALARSEVNRHDVHSEPALAGLQALVETRLARLGERDPQEDTVAGALHWIETHLSTRQPLARLADFLGVSTATVHRLFRERLGKTVRQKIAEVRHEAATRMLAAGEMTIKEIAYRLGYRHPHDFTRAFRNHAGVLPVRQVPSRSGARSPRRRAPADSTARPAAA